MVTVRELIEKLLRHDMDMPVVFRVEGYFIPPEGYVYGIGAREITDFHSKHLGCFEHEDTDVRASIDNPVVKVVVID